MKSSALALIAALPLLVATTGCGLLDRCSSDANSSSSKHVTTFVTPVSEAQLAALLPEVAGLQRETPKTEARAEGKHKLTRAYTEYNKQLDDKVAKLKLEIVDGTHFQAVNSRLAILAHSEGDAHRKAITVKDQKGIQRFLTQTESFEVLMVVGGRFLVTLEGGKDVDKQDINAVLEAVDYTKLEALAKEP